MFKVGDRVMLVTNTLWSIRIGDTGTIKTIEHEDEDAYKIGVRWDIKDRIVLVNAFEITHCSGLARMANLCSK